jgi:hypothetical protein
MLIIHKLWHAQAKFKMAASGSHIQGDPHSVSHIDRGGEPQSNMAVPPALTLVHFKQSRGH